MPLSNLASAIVVSVVLGGALLLAMFLVHIIGQVPEENEAYNHSEEEDKEARNYFYGLVYAEESTELTNTEIFEDLSLPLYHYLHFNDAETLINLPTHLLKSNITSIDNYNLSIIEVGVPASNKVIQNESCPICRSTIEKKPFQLTKIQIKDMGSDMAARRKISYRSKEELTPPCLDCQTNIIQQSTETNMFQDNPEVLAAAHL